MVRDAGRRVGERLYWRAGVHAQAVMRGQSGANGAGCRPACGRAIVRAGGASMQTGHAGILLHARAYGHAREGGGSEAWHVSTRSCA